MNPFPTLFSPLKIGSLTLKNRIEAAPMGVSDLTPEGYLTRENMALYENRAKGGAAIVTIGESLVHSKTGKAHGRMIPLDDEEILPSLIDTFDAIKRHGAVASIELIHAGRRANPKYTENGLVYGPSSGESIYGGPIVEMDEQAISMIVEAFGDAAEMAKLAGADMCMIHGGHGWLLGQFLSPLNNRREDQFGGSIENRMRISLMVIDNIRKKCGPDFPIEFRISGSEFINGGHTLEDAIAAAKLMEGKVDLIHVSATSFHNPDAAQRMFPNMFMPRGCNVYLAEAIKKVVKTPVATVGALNNPQHMEDILSSGQADVVALARALVADPHLPNKARKGDVADITPCLRCNLCLSGSFVPYIKYATRVSRCTVNPLMGREFELKFEQPSQGRKKVFIAGGGPGGMQAAITAADRGHEVVLCEKSGALGGALKHAAQAEFKADLKNFTNCLIQRVEKRPIQVMLNTLATADFVRSLEPDVVIAAIGAEAIVPNIEGLHHPKVVTVTDLSNPATVIGQTVVVIGGGLVGCEEGLALAKKGHHVTLIEIKDRLATDAPYLHWRALMMELEDHVKAYTNMRCTRIDNNGVAALSITNDPLLLKADTVLMAVGYKARSSEVESLRHAAPDFKVIGDCLKPAKLLEAVHMGYFTAMSL